VEAQSVVALHIPAEPDSLFFKIVNSSPYGIALQNLDGAVLYANSTLCSMLGLSEEEISRKHCSQFSPPEDAAKDWALFQQLRSGSIHRYEIEKEYYRADGSLIWGRLFVSLLNNRPCPIVIAWLQDITDRKKTEEELTRVSGKLIETQEQERTRIARELHDDISQRVALVSIQIYSMLQDPNCAPELQKELCDVKQEMADISSGLHSIAYQLYSPELEHLGLSGAVRSLCRQLAARAQVVVDFHCEDVPKSSVSRAVSLCLFRILQEGLHNAVKHSAVKKFKVTLQVSGDELHLLLSDNGTGFDLESVQCKGGLGLTSMFERVRLINGTLTIDSRPQRGTTIEVRVPLES
jgi:PAS domain S-box-containing protein